MNDAERPGPSGVLPLTFRRFTKANVTRCEETFHPVDEWSPTDWACAVAGEVGEACNLIKKLKRGDPVALRDIAFELADAVTYIDLLCVRLGIDLEQAMRAKFNHVSNRVGSTRKLPVTPEELALEAGT